PLPVIADLDSDGINELIVATGDGAIKVMVFPSHDLMGHSILPHLHTKVESSIRDENNSSDHNPFPVAMATGCLQASASDSKGCYEVY
ncbi:hypothetical protein QZH41_009238, partial [Actinostola sp. cb2023]